ncbi:uncharacterized protein LOC128884318 [Hylaeus volcanicus]|uniref:uncharacterized protein LOC128884318 n=1 Tax=Hylaeus volcanicus TaxID=313075 RepID=UPI0023B8486C|nr:uncharacterized protein LOC128884318 [Hylaeus volcanicus]XP_053993603.1 uncharacterized protein LOC128884318 [Hylaeus volcanicus]XP_053993604.1 uncharacterized protein LOC128884318 [Hylaeus volcanicus]
MSDPSSGSNSIKGTADASSQPQKDKTNQLVVHPLHGDTSESGRDLLDDLPISFPFSTKRPRDLGAGLSSGLKSAAKGIGLGVTSLVVAPTYGAIQEGFAGFLKGLGAGVAMAIAFPVTGLGIGIAQAARGVINTPEAVIERRAGKKWDKEKREWRDRWYSIETEKEDLEARQQKLEAEKQKNIFANQNKKIKKTADSSQSSAKRQVADTYYYELLGVEPNASPIEIRKMYYRLARECHPDKHPDDPEASAKFQALGDAYQVLGDPQRRERYDLNGKSVLDDMPVVESKVVFVMLFGAEEFEPFVGRLRLVSTIESSDSPELTGKLAEEVLELEQKRRELNLAILLRERIAPFVNGSVHEREQWRKVMHEQTKELCMKAFGDGMVEAIGWTYENYAYQFLGNLDSFLGLGGRYAKIQAKNREMTNFCRIATTAVRASLAARRLTKINGKADEAARNNEKKSEENTKSSGEKQPVTSTVEEQKAREEGAKQLKETLPLLFGTMLELCLVDIQNTVRQATKKILKDMSTRIEIRREQAKALIELGQIFQDEANKFKQGNKDKKVDVFKHMEDAYIRAAVEADKGNKTPNTNF